MEDAIRYAVAKQEAAGIDVVSDGEYRRIIYTDSWYGAVDGFELTDAKMRFHNDDGDELPVPFLPAATKRLERTSNPLAEEARFLSSVASTPFKVTLSAPSSTVAPESFRPDLFGDAYSSHDELADHVVSLQREMIDEVIAEGAKYVQMDLPFYPYLVDADQKAKLASENIDPDTLLDLFLRIDKAVIDGLPDDVETATHLCRGNLNSLWLWSGTLEPIAERMFHELPYDRFLLEFDDLERTGDFSQLRHVPRGENGPVIVLGLISTKIPELEDQDDIIRQIEQASKHIPIEQLALSPQCGFASNAMGNQLDEDTMWRKLELVSKIAGRVW